MFLAFLLVASASLTGQAQETKIKVNMGWQPTMNGARFFVAEAEDMFAKEGLDVNLLKFTAGPPSLQRFNLAVSTWAS